VLTYWCVVGEIMSACRRRKEQRLQMAERNNEGDESAENDDVLAMIESFYQHASSQGDWI
jgi:hypothetical protein